MTEQTLELPSQTDRSATPLAATTFEAGAVTESSAATPSLDRGSNAGALESQSNAWGASSEGEDFDYIPVSPWAPIALSLGVFGLTGFIGVFGLYVAFFGIFIGIAAVTRIRASAGFVKGAGLAVTGLVLSVASFGLGSAKMAHAYSTEVPEGYQRVNFPKDIAEKEFVYVAGHRKLHPDVTPLIGQKLYLKGFMWATQDTEGLTRFILLKDNGECCFGGKPKSHDFIFVKLDSFPEGQRPALSFRSSGMSDTKLAEDAKKAIEAKHDFQLTTRAYLGMVAVAGVLHADMKAGGKGPSEDFEFAPVYSMDAELVEDAWTRF